MISDFYKVLWYNEQSAENRNQPTSCDFDAYVPANTKLEIHRHSHLD